MATSLSEWIWLGGGGGGAGRCESVWLHKEDGGWVYLEKCVETVNVYFTE